MCLIWPGEEYLPKGGAAHPTGNAGRSSLLLTVPQEGMAPSVGHS